MPLRKLSPKMRPTMDPIETVKNEILALNYMKI